MLAAPKILAATVVGGNEGDLDAAVRDKVAAAVNAYVEQAMTAPLQGKPPGIDALLTSVALAHLTSQQRSGLVDDSVGKARAAAFEQGTAELTGFSGPDDTVTVVNASVVFVVKGTMPDGRAFTIARSGDITFVDDDGAWKIDSFELNVKREIA